MDFQDTECHIDEGSVRDFYIVSYPGTGSSPDKSKILVTQLDLSSLSSVPANDIWGKFELSSVPVQLSNLRGTARNSGHEFPWSYPSKLCMLA